MRNIHYFIKKFGNFDISQLPFNEVDALIFSQMAYLDFSNLVGGVSENKPYVSLQDFNNAEIIKKLVKGTMSPIMNSKMLRLMFKSNRYRNLRFNYYRSRFDKDLELQFSAVVLKLDGCNFIAFRGTDLTLIGWKEDFNMAFMDVVPSQEQCLMYVRNVANLIQGDFYLGGHSKGGNLANFSGIYTDKELQDRIIKIYDFDGPGFKYDIFTTERYKKVADKIKKYITRDSMVGVIMHNVTNYEVVRCYGVSMMQHDPFRWRVTDEGRLDITESTTFNCKVFERAIKAWLDCYPEAERLKIIDILFDLLTAYEKSTIILDFRSKILQNIHAIRKRYKNLDPETVAYLKKTFHEYWNLYHYVRKNMKNELKQSKKHKLNKSN